MVSGAIGAAVVGVVGVVGFVAGAVGVRTGVVPSEEIGGGAVVEGAVDALVLDAGDGADVTDDAPVVGPVGEDCVGAAACTVGVPSTGVAGGAATDRSGPTTRASGAAVATAVPPTAGGDMTPPGSAVPDVGDPAADATTVGTTVVGATPATSEPERFVIGTALARDAEEVGMPGAVPDVWSASARAPSSAPRSAASAVAASCIWRRVGAG